MLKKLFLIAIIVLVGTVAAQEDTRGRAKYVYDFPSDHYLHVNDPTMTENYVEWFYFTGIDEAGLWGFQFTLFHATPPEANGAGTFLYDVALSDLTTKTFYHYRGLWLNTGQISESEAGWQFKNENLLIAYDATLDAWTLAFNGPMNANSDSVTVSMTFTLANDRYDYYLHAEEGVSGIGDCPKNRETLEGYTYYYTHPGMGTTGNIVLDGQEIAVAGETWYDHQWGNFYQCQLAWDWFSLRFDDGSFMMIFSLLNRDGEFLNLLGITYIDSKGNAQYWQGAEDLILTALRTWEDPTSGTIFPIEWLVETPVGTYTVTPFFDEQVAPGLPIIPDYWEGVIMVMENGEQVGLGYLEVAR